MKISVLLADDHAILRDGLKLLLESNPKITVIGEADNGRDAVERAKRLRPDVVIMDIAMPKVNGIEATASLKHALPSAKVIILSMHSTKEHICRALHAGAKGYLLKESAGVEVADAISAVMRGEIFLSRKIPGDLIVECQRFLSKPEETTPLESLSPREREVLQLVVEGHSSAEIADMLRLSPKSVDTYRCRLMQKLNIHDVPGLVKFAIQHGLTPLK